VLAAHFTTLSFYKFLTIHFLIYSFVSRLKNRGVYFACIVFHEDKVLVTTEEFPPVVEVDDTYPASVNNDFHWLMKVFIDFLLAI
jgi:hypothetical protein